MNTRRKLLLVATLGSILSSGGGIASAQVPGTNLGSPQTQPQPGGGVSAGPGAPTSALDNAGTRRPRAERQAPRRRYEAAESRRGVGLAGAGGRVQDRGPPPAGGAGAVTGGDPSSGQLAPNGAIRPGTSSPGGPGPARHRVPATRPLPRCRRRREQAPNSPGLDRT